MNSADDDGKSSCPRFLSTSGENQSGCASIKGFLLRCTVIHCTLYTVHCILGICFFYTLCTRASSSFFALIVRRMTDCIGFAPLRFFRTRCRGFVVRHEILIDFISLHQHTHMRLHKESSRLTGILFSFMRVTSPEKKDLLTISSGYSILHCIRLLHMVGNVFCKLCRVPFTSRVKYLMGGGKSN